MPRAILVDSTRAGKRMPDALSKTVPIWCAVINRVVHHLYHLSLDSDWDMNLYTPPGTVSAQEHHQIEQKVDAWAHSLAVRLPSLRSP
jgi:tRNA A64-2'-O-ribosylphosphate transferase